MVKVEMNQKRSLRIENISENDEENNSKNNEHFGEMSFQV